MKYLVNGVAVAAALVIAAPVLAQNPSGGAPAPAPVANSAMPPVHHAARHAKAMHAFHKGVAHRAPLSGDTTAQLNREELARLQTGGPPMPPPPPAPMPPANSPSGGNSMGMPGPNAGGPGLTPYSGGAPAPYSGGPGGGGLGH
jgi:hypothetical protein